MANTISDVRDHGEFWRPPLETREQTMAIEAESCPRCRNDFVVGSRFCHVCGTQRQDQLAIRRVQWARFFGIHRLLGLPIASVISLSVGVICALAAIGTGLIYTATTVLDWQAVQVWRIEWLLAAIVSFLAGILLKGGGSTKDSEE